MSQKNLEIVMVARRSARGYGSGVNVSDRVIHVFTLSIDKIVRFEGFSDRSQALEAVGLRE